MSQIRPDTPHERPARVSRARALLAVVATLVVALAAAGAMAAQASAAAQFKVFSEHFPTNFEPGGTGYISIGVRNTGDAPTAGTITLRNVLPPGFEATAMSGSGWTCPNAAALAGNPTPTCTRNSALNVKGTAPRVAITVSVPDGPPPAAPVLNTVEAEGGGGTLPGGGVCGAPQPPCATASDAITVSDVAAPAGIEPGSFDAGLSDYQAGGHPNAFASFRMVTELTGVQHPLFSPASVGVKGGAPKDVVVEVPKGLFGNPRDIPRCTMAELYPGGDSGPSGTDACPAASQVGYAEIITIQSAGGGLALPLATAVYNMVPARGEVALFGMRVQGASNAFISVKVRSDGDYGLTTSSINIHDGWPLAGVDLTLWGNPADPANDPQRVCLNTGNPPQYGCAATMIERPFLFAPSECGVDGVPSIKVRPWADPSVWWFAQDAAQQVTGCDDPRIRFMPSMAIDPDTSRPDAPMGLRVDLEIPHDMDNANALATPPLEDAEVRLPKGVTISPSAADGLAACSDNELGIGTKNPMKCPQASKIASVEVESPVLEEKLTGGIYVRTQASDDPASGQMFRIALVVENEERGLSVRLPGSVAVDPDSGQIVTRFDDNPQLPVSRISIVFKGGPRAPLATPTECGTHTIETTLTSWGGQSVDFQDQFTIDCPGQTGFAPSFDAGSVSPTGGAFSPFNLVVAREDRTKELKAIKSVRLPEGLLGRVASVPLCGEAQAAAGTCPESSRVGHVQAALGAGSSPLWVPQAGKEPTAVYLSGPWRGAPYSLSIVVPAQAGPFNLGRVVVRSALHVDERTAAITTGVDETRLIETDGTVTEVLPEALPLILKGVVLNQREIRVIVDRDDFMVNPTDCSQKQITAEIYSVDGDRADVGNRFRAADCALLGFKPKFRARILDKGRRSTLRSFHPRTRFAVVPRKGDANIGGARVVLPSSTLLDQANIGTTCTRAQMAERKCPEASIVGYAKAWSPLLRDTVEGPVYLAANGGVRPLPDLAAVLDGEIRVVLQGEVSTLRTGKKARLQNTFRVVPDAPVKRFELTMRGGAKRGLLVNSADLCRTKERGVAVFQGQNGRTHRLRPRIANSFKGCGKVRREAARRKAANSSRATKGGRRA